MRIHLYSILGLLRSQVLRQLLATESLILDIFLRHIHQSFIELGHVSRAILQNNFEKQYILLISLHQDIHFIIV